MNISFTSWFLDFHTVQFSGSFDFFFKLVIIILLVVQGSKVYLPMPSSWLEALLFISCSVFLFKNIFYLFIFRERKEGETEVEKHQFVVVYHVTPTNDLAHNPGMCSDWELNQRPFSLQAGVQSTQPH